MSRHSGKSTSNRKSSKNTAMLSNKKKNVRSDIGNVEEAPPAPDGDALPTSAGDASPHPAGDVPSPSIGDTPPPPTGNMPLPPTGNTPLPPTGDTPLPPDNSEHFRTNAPKKDPEKTKRILIWLLLGVLASCAPLLLSILRDFACGFNTLKVNYFRDLALIVVAVAANAWSCALGALGALRKYWGTALSATSLVIGIALYYMFRPDEQLNNTALNTMIIICIILLFINMITGIIIEWEEPNDDRRRTA